MKLILIISTIILHLAVGQLLYVNSGVYKFIIGFSLPVSLESPGHGLGWLVNLQGLYRLPDNITYFSPYKVLQKRSIPEYLDRPIVYEVLKTYMNRMKLDGEDCLCRLICATGSLGPRDDRGILATLLRILFTPNQQLDEKYISAYNLGTTGDSTCNSYNCSIDLEKFPTLFTSPYFF